MINSKKKGFTIVELVIVIAVVAILAAVLIPTFSNLIKKANQSADIQATRQMNTFLATANVTGDIETILDVYDLFEESGFDVDSYTPLVDGASFYFDKASKQVIYYNEQGEIIFPELSSEQIAKLDIISLDMSIEIKEPTNYNETSSSITATVKSGAEYAYVIAKYNEANNNTSLELTIDGVIDLKGASVEIPKTKGAVTITGVNGATLKNITTNKFYSESVDTEGNLANYNAAALIVEAGGAVTISNITLDYVNVKGVFSGNMAFLVAGSGTNDIVIENVHIKNSTLVGHRSMGAYVGYFGGIVTIKGNNSLENVKVLTIGGRSALLAGRGMGSGSKVILENNANVSIDTNTKLDIYTDSAVSKQEVMNGKNYEEAGCDIDDSIIGCSTFIKSVKTINGGTPSSYSVYGFDKDALWLANGVGSTINQGLKSYKTIEEMRTVE